MHIWTFDRTKRKLIPFTCRVIKTGGNKYVVWGRFRIRLLGKTKGPVFMDQYELHKVDCVVRSRNSLTITAGVDKSTDHMVAVHLILPSDHKGKCIFAANGKRILYDYKKKGDSPSGYFSVMAFIYIPANELISAVDYVDGLNTRMLFSNMDGEISYSEKKQE